MRWNVGFGGVDMGIRGRAAAGLMLVLSVGFFAWVAMVGSSTRSSGSDSQEQMRGVDLCGQEEAPQYAEFYWDRMRTVDQELWRAAVLRCRGCPETPACGAVQGVARRYAVPLTTDGVGGGN